MPELFISTGEQSGDMLSAEILKKLKVDCPDLICSGIIGKKLSGLGVEEIARAEELSLMGFSDVLPALPRIIKLFYRVRDAILEKNPDAVLLVDAATFNLRMAKALRKKGYSGKIVQYISPTVWAWGNQRKFTMADNLDLLMTIYPFEKKYFQDTSLRVEYVGHPLVEATKNWKPNPNWRKEAGIHDDRPLISLFPGSRSGEILRNLPIMLESLKQLNIKDYLIAISAANPACQQLIEQLSQNSQCSTHTVPITAAHYDLMADSQAAIAKSGTVTLELALFSCPTIVSYKLSTLNKWIAKYFLKLNLPHYCIVNILADETVFPEFIAEQPTPDNLASTLNEILTDPAKQTKIRNKCAFVREILTQADSSAYAAGLLKGVLI